MSETLTAEDIPKNVNMRSSIFQKIETGKEMGAANDIVRPVDPD